MINHGGHGGHRERLRELAQVSGRLVELARVQSVTGQILNINPVPRKVADPILKSLRRKLEEGGDREAVRAAFLGGGGNGRGGRRHATSSDPGRPRIVEIDGKKSLLHYRIAAEENGLKPRGTSGVPEQAMRQHVVRAGSDTAISTTVSRYSARRFLGKRGENPVEGVYATPLDELVRNQRQKTKAAMINAEYPNEQEITQIHGDNLIKVRKHRLNPESTWSTRPTLRQR